MDSERTTRTTRTARITKGVDSIVMICRSRILSTRESIFQSYKTQSLKTERGQSSLMILLSDSELCFLFWILQRKAFMCGKTTGRRKHKELCRKLCRKLCKNRKIH